MITHPGAAGVLAPGGPDDRWHYAREWRSGQPWLADCPEGQLAELIATAAGVPGLQPGIERVSVFSLPPRSPIVTAAGAVFWSAMPPTG